jgi:hypothetical protein
MRLVHEKPIQRLFWVKEYRPLKTVLMGTEAGVPLMQQPMDPLYKKLISAAGTIAALMSLTTKNLWPISTLLRKLNT